MLLLITAAVVIGFFIIFAMRLMQPPMSLLYSGLESTDSGKIVSKLESMNVPYELRGDGSQILVPSENAVRLRMAMAEEGLPSGGSIGYEVFDRSDAIGATRTLQNINLLRALEGELARTIRSLATISAARVHLVLPKRELFSREKRKPSASIIVTLGGGGRLTKAQVMAIQHLVAAAVPGLKPARVSIVDSRGALLARGTDGDDTAVSTLVAQDHRAGFEDRLKRMIERLLERSVGLGRVRAEVSAEIDYDRIVTNSEIFDPEGQVVRSSQLVEEESSSIDPGVTDSVSVAGNLPGGEAQTGPDGGSRSTTTRTEETTNYEVSKTIRNHVRESGTVKRMSVAVLVDGTYTEGAGGEPVYKPRGAEEMQQLTKLVRSAIGFDAARGDTVELVNMAFAQVEVPEAGEPPLLDLAKADYFKIGEIAVLLIVGLLVVLLVLRPLATHAFTASPRDPEQDPTALPSPEQPPPLPATTEASETEDLIDLERIEGRVKESSISKITEIVESHPNEALTIIRNWLYQEA